MNCKDCKGIDQYILANALMKAPEIYKKCLRCSMVRYPITRESK